MYQPINEKEELIKAQLIENGIAEKDIKFCSSFYDRYVRIGYWKKLSEDQLQKIDSLEETFYEDDDGDGYRGRPIIRKLYSYSIK